MGRYIKYSTKWPPLYEGDVRFSAVVNNWNASKGYLSVLPQLSIPFSRDNVIDNLLNRLLSMSVSEVGTPEVDFTMCKNQSSTFPARLRLSSRTIRGIKPYKNNLFDGVDSKTEEDKDKFTTSSDYPPIPKTDLQPVYQMIIAWKDRKAEWKPIGTLMGIIESIEAHEKSTDNVEYTGYISCQTNKIFFHSFQIIDNRLISLIEEGSVIGTEVKFELAFNPTRRKNVAPCADFIRLPSTKIDLPSIWSNPYNSCCESICDTEAINVIKGQNEINQRYSSLQPWLPVYESLLGNKIQGLITPDFAHYNQYYIKDSNGRTYGFRHIQVWDEDLYIAMMSPLRNNIDWGKIPVTCATVPDPTKPDKLLADQIVLTEIGRKSLHEQTGLQMITNNTGLFLFSPRKDFIPQPVTQKKEIDLQYGIINIITQPEKENTIHHGYIQSYYSINGTGKIQVNSSIDGILASFTKVQIPDEHLRSILDKQLYRKILLDFTLCFDTDGDLVANHISISETEENIKIIDAMHLSDYSDEVHINNSSDNNNETNPNQHIAIEEAEKNQSNVKKTFCGQVVKISMDRGNNRFVDIRLDSPFYYLPDGRYDMNLIHVNQISLRLDKAYSVKDADLQDALSRGETDIPCQFDIAVFSGGNNPKFIAVNAEMAVAERVRLGLKRSITTNQKWHEYNIYDCILNDNQIGYLEDSYLVNGWIVDATKNTRTSNEWYISIALRRPIVLEHEGNLYAFSHATTNTSRGNWFDQELLSHVNDILSSVIDNKKTFESPILVSIYLKRPTMSESGRIRLYACNISKPETVINATNLSNLIKYIDVFPHKSQLQKFTISQASDSGWNLTARHRADHNVYKLSLEKVIDTRLLKKLDTQSEEINDSNVYAIINNISKSAECVFASDDGIIHDPITLHFPVCLSEGGYSIQNQTANTYSSVDNGALFPRISGFDMISHPYIRIRTKSNDEHWKVFNAHKSIENLRTAIIADIGRYARRPESYRQVAYLSWLLWFDEKRRNSLRSAIGYAANTKASRKNPLNTVGKLDALPYTPWPQYNEDDVLPFLNFLFRLPDSVENFSEISLDAFKDWIARIEEYLGVKLSESSINETRQRIQTNILNLADWVNSIIYDEEENFRKINTNLPKALENSYELLSPEERKCFNQFTEILNQLKTLTSFVRASEKKSFIHKEITSIKLAMQEAIDVPSLFGTEILYPAYEKMLSTVSRLFDSTCRGNKPIINIYAQCEIVPGTSNVCIQLFLESAVDSSAVHEMTIKLLPNQTDKIFQDEKYLSIPENPEICQIKMLESGEKVQISNAGWLLEVNKSVGVNVLHPFKVQILIDYSWDTLDKVEFNSERNIEVDIIPSTNWGKIKDPWAAVYTPTAQRDKTYVFGRKEDLEKIFEKIWDSRNDEFKSCNIVIFGQRRIGKSTFAYRFKTELEELALQHPAVIADPYSIDICVSKDDAIFDFDQMITGMINNVIHGLPDDLMQAMLDVEYLFSGKGLRGLEEFFISLKNACSEYNQEMPHVFITLDEFTALYKPLSVHDEYRSIVAGLLSLQDNFPVTLILVAIDHYTSMISYYSHARSHIEEFCIKGLSEEGGIQLLSLKTETDNNYILNSPLISVEYAKRIWALTAGNPHIIIDFGHKLVEFLDHKKIYRLETEELYSEYIDHVFNSIHPRNILEKITPLVEDGRFAYNARIAKIHEHLNTLILNLICEGTTEVEIYHRIEAEIGKYDEQVYHPVIDKLLSYEGVIIPENILNLFKESKLAKDCKISSASLIEWLIERNVLYRNDNGELRIVMPYYNEFYKRRKDAMLHLAARPIR